MKAEGFDIFEIPLVKAMRIQATTREGAWVEAELGGGLENHLGTMHAGAIFTIGETTAGAFLLSQRGERTDILAMVRSGEVKYSRPVKGKVFGVVTTEVEAVEKTLAVVDQKGRGMIDIGVEVIDEAGAVMAKLGFRWLLQKG